MKKIILFLFLFLLTTLNSFAFMIDDVWITGVECNGEILKISDGTVIKVDSIYAVTTVFWAFDDVKYTRNYIYNKTTNEKALIQERYQFIFDY